MNFTKLLQNELREKGYLSIQDVINLSQEYNHYFDTARRKLEPDITPYSEKVEENHRIKGWRYLEEKDIGDFVAPVKEKVQEPLFNMRVPLN
jgi:hypothetical protein